MHRLDRGKPGDGGATLPAYLRRALLKFADEARDEITRTLLAPKLVERHHQAGAPKSNLSRKVSAYELAGRDLGISARSAQTAYSKNPVNPSDVDAKLDED